MWEKRRELLPVLQNYPNTEVTVCIRVEGRSPPTRKRLGITAGLLGPGCEKTGGLGWQDTQVKGIINRSSYANNITRWR